MDLPEYLEYCDSSQMAIWTGKQNKHILVIEKVPVSAEILTIFVLLEVSSENFD